MSHLGQLLGRAHRLCYVCYGMTRGFTDHTFRYCLYMYITAHVAKPHGAACCHAHICSSAVVHMQRPGQLMLRTCACRAAPGRSRLSLQPSLQGLLSSLPDVGDTVEEDAPADLVHEEGAELLTQSEITMLVPLMDLHAKMRGAMLSAMHAPWFRPQDVRWRTVADVDDFLAGRYAEVSTSRGSPWLAAAPLAADVQGCTFE